MADLSSLVIRLSADVAQLQGDMGKAVGITQRASDQMTSAFKGAGDVIKEFAAGLVAAFTVDKILEVGKASVELGDSLSKMSQKVGVSVESLSALRNVGQLADASFEDLGAGMVKLARNAADAAAGGKEQAAAFQAVGVSVKDANGNLRPMQDILNDVAKRMASFEDSTSKTALATKLFGKSGAELIPVLNQLGTEGFEAVTQAARDYNQVIGTEQAKQSEAFNDNLTRLSMSVSGFANAILKEMLPGLVAYSNDMADAAKSNDGYASSAVTVSNAVKGVVLVFTAAKETISGLVTVVLGLGDVLGAVGDLFNGFARGVGNDLTAVGEAMRGNFTEARAALNQAGTSLSEGWEKASVRVRGAWEAVQGGVGDAVSNTKKAYNDLFGAFSNVSNGAETTAGAIKKINAPLAESADAAKKAADAAASFIEQLEKSVATYGQTQTEAKRYEAGLKGLSAEQMALATSLIDTLDAWDKYSKVVKASDDAIEKFSTSNVDLQEQIAQGRDKLNGLSDAQVKYNAAIRDANKLAAAALALGPPTEAVQREIENNLRMQATLRNQANAQAAVSGADQVVEQLKSDDPYAKQLESIKKLQDAIDIVGDKSSKAFDPAKLKEYTDAQEKLNKQIAAAKFERSAQAVSAGLSSLQSLAKEGSRAYAEMQVAIDAANIAAAIGAIVNQGMGDPYTAFARIAAMAALMATFVHDIGTAGSAGFTDSAAQRQQTQGTGSVLGDTAAKSESISKAVDITANATTQLVGLNRGMLTALQALQSALGAAGGSLARGAADANFTNGNYQAPGTSTVNFLAKGDPLFLLGGKSKITDQGIEIFGGALTDLLNNVAVGAYQEVQSRSWTFGSTHTNTDVQKVSDEFNKQFQLVIGSIVDTVKKGASALGLLPADVEAALAQYKVEAAKISLKGLSSADQQKELEAVFSKIFDGVAGAVVPFIGKFQKVGEGLGETLVRVATEVQVTQEAFKQLGITVAALDPEHFAQVSDSLVDASGGLDSFISGMKSFVQNFSSAAHQFGVDTEALNSAFSQVGLTVPATRDGMMDLMQSLDATTESGRAQIATLLRLSDVAASYYDKLDDFSKELGLSGKSDFSRELLSIRDSAIGLIKALQAAGASQATLQHVYDASVGKINALILQLKDSAESLAFSLGLTTHGSLDQVNAEVERLQGLANSGANAVSGFGDAMQSASQQASDAINLLLGDLSPLNDQQKLATALQGLYAGTVSQTQVLEIGRRLYATGQQYTDLFNTVMQHPGAGSGASGGGSSTGGTAATGLTAAESQRLADLLKEQQQLQASQTFSQFKTLAQQIAEISLATGETYQQIIDEMGIKDADLEKGLKLANDDALKAYLDNLKQQQDGDKDNTNTIVAVLNRIYDALVNSSDQPGTPGGHSTRPSGGDVPNSAIVDAIDRNTGSQQQYINHTLRLATTGNASQNRGLRTPDLV